MKYPNKWSCVETKSVPRFLVKAPIPFLVPPNDTRRLIDVRMYLPLKRMYKAAIKDRIYLYGVSAYRSYERQMEIYIRSLLLRGIEHTKNYIAMPGLSEHQTGLAIDLSCKAVSFELVEEFADTKEGKWLKANCEYYGFTISYPKELVKITGFQYEPWHIRLS